MTDTFRSHSRDWARGQLVKKAEDGALAQFAMDRPFSVCRDCPPPKKKQQHVGVLVLIGFYTSSSLPPFSADDYYVCLSEVSPDNECEGHE